MLMMEHVTVQKVAQSCVLIVLGNNGAPWHRGIRYIRLWLHTILPSWTHSLLVFIRFQDEQIQMLNISCKISESYRISPLKPTLAEAYSCLQPCTDVSACVLFQVGETAGRSDRLPAPGERTVQWLR